MPELFLSIPLAVLILLACFEAGRLVLSLIVREPVEDDLQASLVRLAVGYVAIEFIVTLAATAHLLRPWLLWAVVVLLVISAVAYGRRPLAGALRSLRKTLAEVLKPPLNRILGILVLVGLAMDLVLTFVPTTAWDALTYHYPLPVRWLEAGGFIPVPDICYHQLPCASEMLFALAFGLGGIHPDGSGIGALAANHLTWATGAFACLALLVLTRKLGTSGSETSAWDSYTPGLVAVLAFLSLPIVYIEEMEGGYVDNFIVFLSLSMLLVLLSFRDNKKPSQILLIGVLTSGLLASKHTNLFLAALTLVILATWLARVQRSDRRWGTLGVAVILALVFPALWYAKSLFATGNPVYPFAHGYFQPSEPAPEIMYWSNPNVPRSIWGFITYFPRLSWDESIVQLNFRLLSWFFFPLLPFAVWWSIRGRRARVIALFAWVMIVVIYLLAPGEPRYILAAWALCAAIGAWGLFAAFRKWPWMARLVLPILLVLPAAYCLVDRTKEVNRRIPTVIGIATVDQYFEKSLDIQPLIKFVNEETDPDAGVVMVEPRVHLLQRPYRIWYPFPTEPTIEWAAIPAEELLSRWWNDEMQYVLLTFGPNYRALALAEARAGQLVELGYEDQGFPSVPVWLARRATYAEPSLVLDENGRPVGVSRDRARLFDVKSIMQIRQMHMVGNLKPVFIDERAGVVFRIVYPGGESP